VGYIYELLTHGHNSGVRYRDCPIMQRNDILVSCASYVSSSILCEFNKKIFLFAILIWFLFAIL
jgi:hypothetical protein